MSPIERKPLSRLQDVEWDRLATAHGTAADIPAALTDLAAARDAASVQDAYWRLDNHVVLQGTTYESALAAVPFILDILVTTPSDAVRVAAYDLLIEIAWGTPDPADTSTPDLRTAARSLIAPGRQIYANDLRDSPSPDVRRRALDLVATFRDDPGALRALLESVDARGDEQLARGLARELREL
jgi:hypothetical protein